MAKLPSISPPQASPTRTSGTLPASEDSDRAQLPRIEQKFLRIEAEGVSQPGSGVQQDHTSQPQASVATIPRRASVAKGANDRRRISLSTTILTQTPAQLSKMLSTFKVLKDLDPGVLASLPEITVSINSVAGTVLFRQGDPPGCCYVLLSGMVGVFVLTDKELEESDAKKGPATAVAAHKKEHLLDFLPGQKTVDGFSRYHEDTVLGSNVAKFGPGNVVGELALLNEQPRTASIQCLADCEFLVIRRTDFDNVLKEEMVRKGDEQLRFLMEHLPGMREVPVPKPASKPHASFYFRKAKFFREATPSWCKAQ
ncbi:unnamed protein product [Polarella glacialis]|uniref:Cyclic nucleotide-binding domain-containing protein n=1 Tax=Polarella glacialis TaxID=89957 RepID=A0A813ELW0_POLGL|nr:unnamed protein product [Polarella glacialis]CAE8697278.1 unnamed protein product [Polarella glacialis]